MSTPDSPAKLYYYGWIRRGLGTALAGGSTVQASLKVSGTVVSQSFQLRGPGHVIGLDAASLLRTEPSPNTTSFESNLFPFVEFTSADLPWRYTPSAPDSKGRLRPWMVLIVVRDRKGVEWMTQTGQRLPVLSISDNAAQELPNLSESWAWAHVQTPLAIQDPKDLGAKLEQSPESFVSRLLCPRRLEPSENYIACVVPAYQAGVLAGLDPLGSNPDAPGDAWPSSPAPSSIRLPVYHSWRFRTAPGGDFESLVRKLHPVTLDARTGARTIDISQPGAGLPAKPGRELDWQGPLVSPSYRPSPWPASDRATFQTALKGRLAPLSDAEQEPSVGLPIYGSPWAAAAIPGVAGAPKWLDDLNLDPTLRASAEIGARVVRRLQESLVAEAWDEAPALAQADRACRFAVLGAEISTRIATRLTKTKSDALLVQVTQPLHPRVVSSATSTKTVHGSLQSGDVPREFISGTLRRLGRPGGIIARSTLGQPNPPTAVRITSRILAGTQSFTSLLQRPAPKGIGFATGEALTGVPAVANGKPRATPAVASAAPPTAIASASSGTVAPAKPSPNPIFPGLENLAFVEPGTAPQPIDTTSKSDLSQAASGLRSALGKSRTAVLRRLQGRTQGLVSVKNATTPPKRAWFAPQPALALALEVADIDPEFLVPGVGSLRPDSIGILKPNPATIEAMLVGANHAFAQELLWREYPSPPGTTFFRSFWCPDTPDAPPIDQWKGALGSHLAPTSGNRLLAFLVRGELVRRHPEARYYAVRATWSGDARAPIQPEDRRDPSFRGRIDAETLVVTLELTEAEARGATSPKSGVAGWYLVIEEPPAGPRFGLDVARTAAVPKPPTTTWKDLSWSDVAAATNPPAHVPVLTGPLVGQSRDGILWGAGAAQMASITRQPPVRVYVHASQMLATP